MRASPVLLTLALAACGDPTPPLPSADDPVPAPPATGLEVVWSAPVDGAVGVARAATVMLAFSAPLDPMTAHEGSVGLWRGSEQIPVTLAVSGATVQLGPRSLLDLNTTYSVTVSRAVHDTAGRAMIRSYRTVFTTKFNRVP